MNARRNILIGVLLWALAACVSEKASDHFLAEDLKITWELESNLLENEEFKASFTLTNTGKNAIANSDWKLFWSMAPRWMIEEKTEGPVKFGHRNGDLFYMMPTSEFKLAAGESIKVSYYGTDAVIKYSDAPMGLYVAFGEDESKLEVVNNYAVLPFERADQMSRGEADKEPVPSTTYYFDDNLGLEMLSVSEMAPFTPAPRTYSYQAGALSIAQGLNWSDHVTAANDLIWFEGALTDMNVAINENGATISLDDNKDLPSEGYQLKVDANGINLSASDSKGYFYGLQSILALISNANNSEIRHMIIQDAPAFGYRGMHLDVARNFQTKESVMHFIDLMATYKMNALELYLSEDEGWRIEIEELPELTEVGSKRGHSLKEENFLQPSYGSGPLVENDHGTGYYSREEFKEIIQYANTRHVELIPTINVPGHSRAAIKAMENRYRRLLAAGDKEGAEEYLLNDPEDKSKYISAQGYNDNIICVCKDSGIKFFETVLDDIIEMYQEAGVPLRMFHTGGDEVPRGSWTESPICKDFVKDHPEYSNSRNLQLSYFGKILEILRDRKLETGAWEEAVMTFLDEGWEPNTTFNQGDVYPYVWNSIWGEQDLAYRLANAGYPVILCNVSNFYFDLAYNKDPKEPGLYWGGLVDTRKAFEFNPYDLFTSIRTNPLGVPHTLQDFEGMERLKPENQVNIAGLQGELWSETVKGQQMLEYYYLPKIFGLAERAWRGQPEWDKATSPEERQTIFNQRWNEFANRIGQYEYSRLANLGGGYNYRIPLPGAKFEEDQMHANIRFPGLQIRYTTDGTEPDKNSMLYEGPITIDKSEVRLKAFDGNGKSSRTSILVKL